MNADNTGFLKVIGLVTCQKYLDMTPDEQALRLSLAELGVEAVAVAWDDTKVDWTRFDGLVVRTIWNYHEQPTAFRSWLAEIEQVGVAVWNNVPIIRWNMEKTYLRDLADRGVNILLVSRIFTPREFDSYTCLPYPLESVYVLIN